MHALLRSSNIVTSFMAVAALALAAPASAQELAGDKGKDGEKLICKRQAPTGTRFAKKTCRTKAERDKLAEEHKRAASEMIDTPKIYQCNGPAC